MPSITRKGGEHKGANSDCPIQDGKTIANLVVAC
jgi:hypothetical protein